MNALKNTVKAVLPSGMLNYGRKIRDKSQLSSLQALSFKEQNLRSLDKTTIDEILNDTHSNEAWDETRNAIAAIFGDSDKYGGVNPGDRQALYKLLHGIKPQSVLEVGTHIGASTLYIARALKAQNPSAKVTTVDILDVNAPDGPWQSVGLDHTPKQFAEKLDCANQIEFVKSPCVNYMRSTEQKFDFVFLDGDHSASSVYQEISAALDILAPGGIILMHDYYPDGQVMYTDGTAITGPYLAVERIKSENETIRVLPLGALPWPTKQGSHMTSLAVLTKA